MNVPFRSQEARFAGLAVVSSAALFWFGNDLHPWWPLTWFAPLPVLLFAAGSLSWKRTSLVAFAALFLGSFAMWHYFQVLGAPWGWVAVYTLVSTVFMGSVLLFRTRLRAGSSWGATLAFPAAMVSCEYALSFTPGGSAGSLANTQMNFLNFLQLASLTGPYGMSFVLLGFPATMAVSRHLRHSSARTATWIGRVGLGIVVLVLWYGTERLTSSEILPHIKVGLVASDLRENVLVAKTGTESDRLCRRYADAA